MKIERMKRRRAGEVALEMTPMIDVVFLLLIFFLIATSFDEKAGIAIDLPKSSIRKEKVVEQLQVIVQKDKRLTLSYEEGGQKQRRQVQEKDLKKELQKILANSEGKTVLLSADQSLSHGYIVHLMSIAKEAGAKGLNIDSKYQA